MRLLLLEEQDSGRHFPGLGKRNSEVARPKPKVTGESNDYQCEDKDFEVTFFENPCPLILTLDHKTLFIPVKTQLSQLRMSRKRKLDNNTITAQLSSENSLTVAKSPKKIKTKNKIDKSSLEVSVY